MGRPPLGRRSELLDRERDQVPPDQESQGVAVLVPVPVLEVEVPEVEVLDPVVGLLGWHRQPRHNSRHHRRRHHR